MGRGLTKMITKCGKGGRRSKPKNVLTASKIYAFRKHIYIDQCALLSPFYWHIDVVVNLNITFCEVKMLISANTGLKVYIKLRLFFISEFVTFWGVTRGKGVQDKRWQSVRWGRGIKNIDFLSNKLFEWPLVFLLSKVFFYQLITKETNFELFEARETNLHLKMVWKR